MSKVIKIGTLFPKHLNLNGDQANLLALQTRISEYGGSSSVTPVFDLALDFDLVFVGHGSQAAWADIESRNPQLLKGLAELVSNGKTVIAIGSGYVKLAGSLGMDVQTGVHRSEFVDVDGVVGYLNSDSLLPIVHNEKNSLLTLLHGPVLVKNPELADSIISNLGIEVEPKSSYLGELDYLAKESRRIAFEH